MERIYVILHDTKKLAYVGRTSKTIEQRFAQHLADAANPYYEKRLSEALRHEPDAWHVELCDEGDEATEASEATWMERFEAEGYVLLNTAAGAKRAPKRQRTEREGWEERPVFVPLSRTGVSLGKISQAEADELNSLPTAEARWAWIAANVKGRLHVERSAAHAQ